MAPLLPPIVSSPKPQQSFVLLQSSTSQSCLPVLRGIVTQALQKNRGILLFCFLYPPSSILIGEGTSGHKAFDWTDDIPGYSNEWSDHETDIIDAVKSASETTDVIFDSVDTLLSNFRSPSKTYSLISKITSLLTKKPNNSRLLLHVLAPCPLIPQLTSTRFSPSLTHLIAHPPVLLTHVASSYLTPPPPISTPEKFWGVFTPISERLHESEKLVFGSGGEGSGGSEIVIEIIIRGGSDGTGRRKGVERALEGWSSISGTPCELSALESLKTLWTRKVVAAEEPAPDPTKNVSFNLNLTPEQQQSRAQVPLPYAHEGKVEHPAPAAILYDPDSADDIDDDDPDEDLDI